MQRHDLSVAMIATAMELSETELFRIANDTSCLYFPTSKRLFRSGKYREIDPPKLEAKKRLRHLHNLLSNSFSPHRNAHGGVTKRSCFTSARLQLGRKWIITRDVADCFPSIKTEALRTTLVHLGFRSDVAWILARLFTVHGRVPQGSPLSNDALNLYFWKSDDAIRSEAGRLRAGSSRLCDDLVMSLDHRGHLERASRMLDSEIEGLDLAINQKKRRLRGVQPQSRLQIVHGLVVNSKRGVRIERKQWKAALHRGKRYQAWAQSFTVDEFEALAYLRNQAAGWMYHCRQAEFGPARTLRSYVDTGDRRVERRLAAAGLSHMARAWFVSKNACRISEALRANGQTAVLRHAKNSHDPILAL